jgi:hypothetical protein
MEKELNGLIIPGNLKLAESALSLIRHKKAVLFSSLNYADFYGLACLRADCSLKITKNNLPLAKNDCLLKYADYFHKFGIKELFPIAVGRLNEQECRQIAEKFAEEYKDYLFIFLSDLSCSLPYGLANQTDDKSIEIIRNLDIARWKDIDASNPFGILIMINLCRVKEWQPKLMQYKNSGDIDGNKEKVAGYSVWVF